MSTDKIQWAVGFALMVVCLGYLLIVLASIYLRWRRYVKPRGISFDDYARSIDGVLLKTGKRK
jgi:hypothetical protein